MAKLSADGKYVTVESGDTLSEIARDFGKGATYKQIAAVNNISSPYRIYVGQKIYLTKQTSSSSSSNKKTAPSNKAKIDHFGVQSNSNNTLFATWTWSKKNTDNYECQWYYATGDGVWFVGNKSSTSDKQCTYGIPDNATKVRFRVKPVSKKYKKNDKETSYWTAQWTDFKTFDVKAAPPPTPSGLSVKMEKYKLTAELTNLDSNTKKVEFQVVKNDSKLFKTATVAVKTGAASFSCTVDAGAEYKVRCRGINGSAKSAWSDYSENTTTVPAASKGIRWIKALSETSVQIDWENVKNATIYRIEWTTVLTYFDSNIDDVGSKEIQRDDNGLVGHAEITGLESGKEYFFRVRAGNDLGVSAWTEVKSIVLGKKPTAPTTWSSTTTGTVGEDLNLYWVHNAQDGSNQTYAELELIIGGVTETHTIDTTKNYTSGKVSYTAPENLEEGEVVTSCVTLNTTDYVEGTKILWRVRTAGITKDLGEWSIQRTIDVYAPPTLQVNVQLQNGDVVETLEAFPFYISAIAGPITQTPIGYHVSIIANETYETTDNLGNLKIVSAGDTVYEKYFDISTDLMIEMSAGNIDLENGMTYTVKVVSAMNSGLTCGSSSEFSVSWIDATYVPNAEISVDQDTYTAHIRPYCETSEMVYSEVVNGALGYEAVANNFDFVSGEPVEGAFTRTGEQVYFGTTADGEEVYYCEFIVSSLAEGVTLSVYRREFDGTFTEIATGISNNSYTTVTDPHPSLDYARYRIVATDDATGAISYYDLPGYPVGETAVIIQWDEEWSSFDTTNADALEQPAWSGSLLRLPYNIDVSDKHSSDVSFVSYAGRKHPVTYYGTQLGETSSWNVEIRKDDTDTLYALRRLAIWMGDVYVREPSGSGYWASVSVSYSQKHRDLTIPVTLDITRVEGGM